MSDQPTIEIASGEITAEIAPLGAELRRLRDAGGRDLLWDGDPAFWTGRAPILFPVVGAAAGGVIHVDGIAYPMAKHGFARRRIFALVERSAAAATFQLEDDDATRAAYPFAFRLDIRFAIDGAALSIVAALSNPGDAPLPASFGFHPALRWPLPGGAPRAAHRLQFAREETAPIRRIDAAGLIRPDPAPTPVVARALALDDALFVDDALIFDRLASRSLVYGAPGATGLEIGFPDMPHLGIWTKPGAGFLCIEPWQGMADPQGFAGAFRDKPGVIAVAPGATRRFTMRIAIADRAFA